MMPQTRTSGLIALYLSFLSMVLMGSCSLFPTEPQLKLRPTIHIESPLTFKGTDAVLYDTLRAPEGTPYILNVTWQGSEGNVPSLSFNGSGRGTLPADLKLNQTNFLHYSPTYEGRHPIYLYFNPESALDCTYYPEEKVIIFLTVIHTPKVVF